MRGIQNVLEAVMFTKPTLPEWRQRASVAVCVFALFLNNVNAFAASDKSSSGNSPAKKAEQIKTATPIKHVIVLIGENRTFDFLFATYVPRKGEQVKNLLSEGIINADGSLGINAAIAQQTQATAPFHTEYFISLGADQ
jgi:phospholipase C